MRSLDLRVADSMMAMTVLILLSESGRVREMRRGDTVGGRYEFEYLLGRGTMGQVWRARDRHLDRPVAAKMAWLDLGAPDVDRARSRFEREAKAAAALDSANIATVYDAGFDRYDTDAAEAQWLVMQVVEGATLGELLDERGPFAPPTAAAVAAQVCSGLAAAHAVGLVHRDLKPDNVMVRRDGVVKVLDFGLVKVLSETGARLTATGEFIGNLAYASPELIEGVLELDARSDLYSVGCLLHRMLAGAPPFPSKAPLKVLEGHLAQRPPHLSELGIEVPGGLQDLLSALLEKDRSQRPDSAAAVFRALEAWTPRPALLPSADDRAYGSVPEDPQRPFLRPQAPYPL